MMLLSAFLLNLALHHLRLTKTAKKMITALTQVPTSDETDFTSHIYLLEGC